MAIQFHPILVVVQAFSKRLGMWAALEVSPDRYLTKLKSSVSLFINWAVQ